MIDIPNEPLLFDLFYGGKGPGEETEEERISNTKTDMPAVTIETPAFRNIHISKVNCKGAGRAMFFNGLPEMNIENVTVRDVVITDAAEGVVISQADGVTMENICIETKSGSPTLRIKNSKNIAIDGKQYKQINANGKNLTFK